MEQGLERALTWCLYEGARVEWYNERRMRPNASERARLRSTLSRILRCNNIDPYTIDWPRWQRRPHR